MSVNHHNSIAAQAVKVIINVGKDSYTKELHYWRVGKVSKT